MKPLNLRRHYPTEISCWVSEDPTSENLLIEAQVGINAGHNTENKLDWRIVIAVNFSAKDGAKEVAKGSIKFVGFFDVPDDIPESKRAESIVPTGVSILYSATRELVANLTARVPDKLITLPPYHFGNLPDFMKGEPKQVVTAKV